jgi:deoxyribose-phosphate aldolase
MTKNYHRLKIRSGIGKISSGKIVYNLAGMIDHTLLKPDATKGQIVQLCKEAEKYKFASVCVNPYYVSLCVNELMGTRVNVCTVIGFPLGASATVVKEFEAEQALRDGAKEIDMVINVGMLKSGDDVSVENDIAAVVTTARKHDAIVKVIIETAILTKAEKVKACLIAKRAGADFIKTSTGFSKGGATVDDVALIRKTVGPDMGVKASGGIRSREDAIALIQSGANRIGTSAGVKIITRNSGNASAKKSNKQYRTL